MKTIAEIKAKVRAIMNEIGGETNLPLLSEDTLKLDSYIEALLPDAVSFFIANAPSKYLIPKVGTVTAAKEGNIAKIVLPDDFYRLVVLRMEGHRRNITVLHEEQEVEYLHNTNPATQAGTAKPVAIRSFNAEGKPIAYIYSLGKEVTTPKVQIFLYIPKVQDGNLGNVSDELFYSICYLTASLIYQTFENLQIAEALKKTAIEMVPKS